MLAVASALDLILDGILSFCKDFWLFTNLCLLAKELGLRIYVQKNCWLASALSSIRRIEAMPYAAKCRSRQGILIHFRVSEINACRHHPSQLAPMHRQIIFSPKIGL